LVSAVIVYCNLNIFRATLVDSQSPSILVRSRKSPGIHVGLRVVDVLFPVAKGQRELVIGDRQSGKSTIWLCSFVSQQSLNAYLVRRRKISSVGSMIGGRLSTTVRLTRTLARVGARNQCALLVSGVTDSMGSQFLGNLAATATAEFLRNRGGHWQAAYDDLSKHAVAYRQMCLFLRKPAGREAYPSDVFYLHARLLERSCNLGKDGLAGSLMSLPVIETLNNDLSAYIATNVISITDGQLYLDLGLFGTGQCPAISLDKSVSRVGAKSLDSLSRSSAFQLYGVVGQIKQEQETALKSDGYLFRYSKYQKFLVSLVQRSSTNKFISQQLLLAIHTGCLTSLPSSLLGIFSLSISSLSPASFGDSRALVHRNFY